MALIERFFLNESVLKFLRSELVSTPLVHIDWWSFVHVGSGFLLGKLLRGKDGFRWAVAILVAFEAYEWVLMGQGIVQPELLADRLWDILAGIAGFWLARRSSL